MHGMRLVLWLTFGALVMATLWVVLRGCELGLPHGPGWFGACPEQVVVPGPDLELQRERERQQELERAIRRLEFAILERPYCPAPALEDEQDAEAETDLAPCPPQRRRTTEVILLLDASTSMLYDFALEPSVERRLLEIARQSQNMLPFLPQAQQLAQEARRLERQAMRPDREDRIDVAKQALVRLVDIADADIDFSFLRFNRCGNPDFVGRYSSPARTQLKRAIQATQLGSATALAQGIAALPSSMNGGQSEDNPVNVVLVSDGSDSCGGDPCAAARRVKQQRPYAYINAIAIGGMADQVRCVPEITGGQFVSARDADDLAPALVRAAGQDLPEHCR